MALVSQGGWFSALIYFIVIKNRFILLAGDYKSAPTMMRATIFYHLYLLQVRVVPNDECSISKINLKNGVIV